jgi:hypothetical protein
MTVERIVQIVEDNQIKGNATSDAARMILAELQKPTTTLTREMLQNFLDDHEESDSFDLIEDLLKLIQSHAIIPEGLYRPGQPLQVVRKEDGEEYEAFCAFYIPKSGLTHWGDASEYELRPLPEHREMTREEKIKKLLFAKGSTGIVQSLSDATLDDLLDAAGIDRRVKR